MDKTPTVAAVYPSAAFFSVIGNPLKYRLFLLRHLPAAYFSGLRIEKMDEQHCVVSVPYKWFTRNPFRSTYFACLSMAAEMSTGVLALGLNYGAYMSEIFRAALASVGRGQREAAIALGMTPRQTMQRIVLPQALRFAIPPIGNDFIAMTKDSALVAATGFVHEIMWRATRVGRAQFHNLEALIMAAIFYWVMTLILSYVQSIIEARLARGDR